jgi:hypothetical protein
VNEGTPACPPCLRQAGNLLAENDALSPVIPAFFWRESTWKKAKKRQIPFNNHSTILQT